MYVLCRERLVVHQKKVNISGIMNDERFVAGRHQMPSFLVRTVSDLNHSDSTSLSLHLQQRWWSEKQARSVLACSTSVTQPLHSRVSTHRRHSSLALETSSDSVVNTLGLPPVCVNTFVGVALVTIEALRA